MARRLTALEQIAEEVRTRPIRRMTEDLARREGFTAAETEAAVAEALALVAESDALIRSGTSPDEVLAIFAGRMGLTAAELTQHCADLFE